MAGLPLVLCAASIVALASGAGSPPHSRPSDPTALHLVAADTSRGIGDECLVGRWLDKNESAPGNWTWNGETIAVSGSSGLVITFTSDGVESEDLAHAEPLVGDYHGHQIEILIRGSVRYRVQADGRQLVQTGMSENVTVRYYYDGIYEPGGTVSFPSAVNTYRCSPKGLHLESPAVQAGYGPQVDDLTRADAGSTGRDAPGSLISSVASSLATPAAVLHAPLTLLVNALVALALVLLVTFPSHLFNRTFEENHIAIRGWWEQRLPWLRRLRRRATVVRAQLRAEVSFGLVVLAGGVLAALLDPRFGPNQRTVALFVGAVLALIAGSAVGAIAAGVYRSVRHRDGPWRLHALPSGLIVAAFCVLISRVTAFQPGYLYGVIGGITFARTLSRREEGHVVALTSIATLVVSLAAWLVWVPVSAASSAAPTAFGWALLSNFLAAVFVSGMVGLLISLVPLRFLPGEKLAKWHRGAWGSVFGLAGLAVIEIMLRPQSAGARVASVPLLTTVGLFLGFGVVSVLFWSYFRVQTRRATVATHQQIEPARRVP